MNFKCSKKEAELLSFIKEFGFGKVELVIHAGEPQKIVIKEMTKYFGAKPLTKNLEELK